jgi:hypothetical protein
MPGALSPLHSAAVRLGDSSWILFFEFGRYAVEATRERQLPPADRSTADDAVPASPRGAPLREAAFGAAHLLCVVPRCHSRSFGRSSAGSSAVLAVGPGNGSRSHSEGV